MLSSESRVDRQIIVGQRVANIDAAVLYSKAFLVRRFSEVLYLDSDNILLADPTYLFDHQLYKLNGAVFWPDVTKDVSLRASTQTPIRKLQTALTFIIYSLLNQGPANPIWRLLNMQCRRKDWQLDSGQILINKRGQEGMNLAALVAALEMQKDYDFWFKISGGVSPV